MSDKIVNHFVLADGSTAKYDATQLAGDVPEVVGIRTGYDGTEYANAGDAVRAGDKINADKANAMKEIDLMDLLGGVEWEQGSLTGVNGVENVDTTRIRSAYIDVSNINNLNISIDSGYYWAIYAFSDTGVGVNETYYNGGGGLITWHDSASYSNYNVVVRKGIKYIRFLIRKNNTTILPNESNTLTVKADYTLLTDVERAGNFEDDFSEVAKQGNFTIPEKYWYQAIPYAIADAHPNGLQVSTTRICSNYIEIPPYTETITITPSSNLRAAYYIYDENGTKLKDMYWSDAGYTFAVESNYKYLVIGLSKSSGNITPAEHGVTITGASTVHFQKIDDISELSTVDIGWEIGSLWLGKETSSTTRLRSRYILVGKGTTLIRNSPTIGDKHLIYIYDLITKAYVSDLAWTHDNIIVENDCYIRILLNKNEQVITESDIETVAATEIIYRTFPQYLMDKGTYEFPAYFESEIDTAIETARDNIFSTGIDGDSFVFISDVHWPNNSKNSPALIKKAVDELNLDKIICGGDLFNGGAKADSIDILSDCVNAYKDIARFYCLFGNHDSNTIGAPSTSDNFTKSEVYALEQKQTDFVMNYGEPCYFYFDNPTTKTRYICLDTGLEHSTLPVAQGDWITATLNSTPDNYHVLVFAHIIYMPINSYHIGITKDEVYRTAFMNTVCTMCDTFNTNNQNKKVEAIFGGHMHFDADFTSDGGIPIVLIDCDARQTFTETSTGSGVANHATGTINEQCFDIVTVDYANETINCVRVGRGSNRTITY